MDNPVDGGPVGDPQEASFGPSRLMAAAIALAATLAAIEAFVTTDRAGRLLLAVAAIVLALIAASDLYFSPRLLATRAGLAIRTPSVRAELAWSEISELRVDERIHLGLASHALEIDSGELLVVLGKRGLGRDPRDVLETLTLLCPPGQGPYAS